MSFTRKPCPACGEVDPYRKPDNICTACQKKLQWAEKKQYELAQPAPSEVIVVVGECSHWNQYIRRGKEIRTLLHQLVMAVSRRKGESGQYFSALHGILGKIDGGGGIEILVDAGVAEIMPQLLAEIQSALDAAYEEGKADGYKLLVGLANGNISINDFERRTSTDAR